MKNHIEIIGESGVSKSSLAGVLLSQLAASGEAWGHFPVHVIDLRPSSSPQINPFKNCRAAQVDELLQVALSVGVPSDQSHQ